MNPRTMPGGLGHRAWFTSTARMRIRPALLPVIVSSTLLSVGCYEYRPVSDTGALSARRVELTLTDSGAVVLAPRIGPTVEAIEGIYLGDSAGAHVLAVAVSRTRNGSETDWRGEHVVVPHTLVSSLRERRFSPTRTAFASALAAIGIGGMTAALRGGGESPGSIPVIAPPTGK